MQLLHQEGAVEAIQSAFPQPPKGSSLATSAPPTIQLAVPLPNPVPVTMPVAKSPQHLDQVLPIVPACRLPLPAGAHAQLPQQPPPVPPPRQQVTGPQAVQPQVVQAQVVKAQGQPQVAQHLPKATPPPLPVGVTSNNGRFLCQQHWEFCTLTHGRGYCLVCDWCYDRLH